MQLRSQLVHTRLTVCDVEPTAVWMTVQLVTTAPAPQPATVPAQVTLDGDEVKASPASEVHAYEFVTCLAPPLMELPDAAYLA